MKKYIIIIAMALIASYATAQSNESKKKIMMVSGTVDRKSTRLNSSH